MPKKKTTKKRLTRKESEIAALERLADWLLDDSISFRALDAYRVELKLDVEAFSKLLGMSTQLYGLWRKNRKVPLKNRDKHHEEVYGYQISYLASQTTRLDAVLGGLETDAGGVTAPLYGVLVASQTTRPEGEISDSPHLFIPLPTRDQAREEVKDKARLAIQALRRVHAPAPGDDYNKCECTICKGGKK